MRFPSASKPPSPCPILRKPEPGSGHEHMYAKRKAGWLAEPLKCDLCDGYDHYVLWNNGHSL